MNSTATNRTYAGLFLAAGIAGAGALTFALDTPSAGLKRTSIAATLLLALFATVNAAAAAAAFGWASRTHVHRWSRRDLAALAPLSATSSGPSQ